MDAYRVYINKIRFPVVSEKIQIKTEGGNKTYTLINGGEVNVLKSRRLNEISMKLLLPAEQYPWAYYEGGKFKRPAYYIDKLLKLYDKPFELIIYRDTEKTADGKTVANPYNRTYTVTLEDMTMEDDPDEGRDVMVSLTFKTYKDYGTKKVKPKTSSKKTSKIISKVASAAAAVIMKQGRAEKVYKLTKKTTLVAVAKKIYGSKDAKAAAKLLYKLNKKAIKKKNPKATTYTKKLVKGTKIALILPFSELKRRVK